MIRPLAYVAGPYSAEREEERDLNVLRADEVGRALLAKGYAPIVPHKMSWRWENDERFGHGDFMAADLAILQHCHLLVLVGQWRESNGAMQEVAEARALGIPVFSDIDSVPSADEFELDTASLTILDLLWRCRRGVARYGRRLYPWNGRDGQTDLYEELLDAALYARQVQQECGAPGLL